MKRKEKNNLTSENFTYWLQGFFEIQNPQELTAVQIQEIKNHLNIVLHKKTDLTLENLEKEPTYCEGIHPYERLPLFPELDCSLLEKKIC